MVLVIAQAQKTRQERRGRKSRLADPKYVASLTALYPTHGTDELSEILGAPLRTIQAHVKKLGLNQKKSAQDLDISGRATTSTEADRRSIAADRPDHTSAASSTVTEEDIDKNRSN